VRRRLLVLLVFLCVCAGAQQPFYTDNSGVTDKGRLHFEFFTELDRLQHSQFPDLWQNTSNYRLNYGLPHDLEIDIDNPLLLILRHPTAHPQRPYGVGDTNLGLKWNFHKEADDSRVPALSATFYTEFPTGDTTNQLGSGVIDYWLNGIAEKRLTKSTKVVVNGGILFAGNTSTGVIGITTTHGRVFTFGSSVIRDFTDRLQLGVETYGGVTSNLDLGRSQLQFLAGGKYAIRKDMSLDFGVLGGKFTASPLVGVQLGISVDFDPPRVRVR
jgi:hypothetical protein